MWERIWRTGRLNICSIRFPFAHLVRECRWVFLFFAWQVVSACMAFPGPCFLGVAKVFERVCLPVGKITAVQLSNPIMKTLFVLALLSTCGAASAQTPAINPMPDGSRDMYAGLGVQSMARYPGAEKRKTSAVPVIQVQWSNGIFVSGMSAGMHLSSQPSFEAGPLLQWQPGRDEGGSGSGAIGADGPVGSSSLVPPAAVRLAMSGNRLHGLDKIGGRLLAGGFMNYYLTPQWRLTSTALWGSGNDRTGATAVLGVQRLAADIGAHQSLSFTAGITLANGNANQAWFGVTPNEAFRSGNPAFDASAGIRDAHLQLHWNWALAPSWLLTSDLQATRLLGSAHNSPLVERPTNLTVSTALAYRF
jgi:MipA family protein